MSLKKSFLMLAAVAFPLTFAVPAILVAADAKPAGKTTFKVDPAASQIKWVGKKVTGQHNGTVPLKDGEFWVEKGALVGGKFTVDIANLVVSDLEGKTKENLTGHLKSDDFFGAAKYPTSAFEITKVEAVTSPIGDATHKITGNLTIKDKTNAVSFPAKVTIDATSVTAVAKNVEIDRTQFGIRYGSGKFFENLGDKTIHDKFLLDISVVAKK